MIRLEYFTKNDFEDLMKWINTEELMMSWAGGLFSFPLTTESLEWYINNINHPEAEAYVFKVIEENSGNIIGHISLGSLSQKNRSGRITRVFISPEARGKSYCRKMVRMVAEFGFSKLKLHRISLGVYDYNQDAIHCYLKAGFKIEGTMRENTFFNNKWYSLVEMSMLENEI